MKLKGLDGYALLEVLVRPSLEKEVLRPLIAHALVLNALPRRPKVIGCMAARGTNCCQALRSLGFWPTPDDFHLIHRALRRGSADVLDRPDEWIHSWGNGDTV